MCSKFKILLEKICSKLCRTTMISAYRFPANICSQIQNMLFPKKNYLWCYYILVCVPFVREHAYKRASISKFHFVKLKLVLNHQHDQLTFLGSKIRYFCVYALTFFISLRVVDAMLPITVKHAVILKSELVNTQVFHL